VRCNIFGPRLRLAQDSRPPRQLMLSIIACGTLELRRTVSSDLELQPWSPYSYFFYACPDYQPCPSAVGASGGCGSSRRERKPRRFNMVKNLAWLTWLRRFELPEGGLRWNL
jgi:hypothetical protein